MGCLFVWLVGCGCYAPPPSYMLPSGCGASSTMGRLSSVAAAAVDAMLSPCEIRLTSANAFSLRAFSFCSFSSCFCRESFAAVARSAAATRDASRRSAMEPPPALDALEAEPRLWRRQQHHPLGLVASPRIHGAEEERENKEGKQK